MKINELNINESNSSDGRPLIFRKISSVNNKNVKSILDIRKFFLFKIFNNKPKTKNIDEFNLTKLKYTSNKLRKIYIINFDFKLLQNNLWEIIQHK